MKSTITVIFILLLNIIGYSQRSTIDLPTELEDIVFSRIDDILRNNQYELPPGYSYKVISGNRIGNNKIIKLRLQYKGIEMRGNDIILFIDKNTGRSNYEKYKLKQLPIQMSINPVLSEETILNKIQSIYYDQECSYEIAELYKMYYEDKGNYILSYFVSLRFKDCIGHAKYIIDSDTGQILWQEKKINIITNGNQKQGRNGNIKNRTSDYSSGCVSEAKIYEPDPLSSSHIYKDIDVYDNALGKYEWYQGKVKVKSYAYYISKEEMGDSEFAQESIKCSDNPNGLNNFSYEITDTNYRTVTVYKHLNAYFGYTYDTLGVSNLAENGFPPVRFDANLISANPNYPYDPYVGYSDDVIRYTCHNTNYYEPMANDLFHVYIGGVDYVLKKINTDISNGVRPGVMDYLAQSYEWQIPNNTDPNCFDYGGLVTPGSSPEDDEERLKRRYTDAVDCEDDPTTRKFDNRQYLSSFLMQLRDTFGYEVIDQCVLITADAIEDTIDTKEKFVRELFKLANNATCDGFGCNELLKFKNMVVDFFGICDPGFVNTLEPISGIVTFDANITNYYSEPDSIVMDTISSDSIVSDTTRSLCPPGVDDANVLIYDPETQNVNTATSDSLGIVHTDMCEGGGTYNVCVTETCDEPCGLNDADILEFRKMILGVTEINFVDWFFVGDISSVAGYNSVGVTTLDLVLMQKEILKIDGRKKINWCRFVPKDEYEDIKNHDWSDWTQEDRDKIGKINNCKWGVAEGDTVEFIKFNLGDIDHSCCKEDSTDRDTTSIEFGLENSVLNASLTSAKKIFGFTMKLDIGTKTVANVSDYMLPGLMYSVEDEILHIIWIDTTESNVGVQLASGVPIISVQFVGDITDTPKLVGDENFILDSNGGILVLQDDVSREKGSIEKDKFNKDVIKLKVIEKARVYPVPVNGYLHIEVPTEKIVKSMEIYAVDGNRLKYIDNEIEKIDVKELKMGLYYIKIEYNDGSTDVLKFVKD